ncbi:MAG: hypothetical protein Q9184_005693 [Pyrenodesmia sp. 2 TL-2023]
MAYGTPGMNSPSSSQGSSTSQVAGVKRPAPSLLPAFEPFPSPTLPRPAKRIAQGSPTKWTSKQQRYPTPAVPTSSTGILSSSPPRQVRTRRHGLSRAHSTLSERTPLATVPTIELDEGSQPILMGRSSNSSHYQLSTNKLVSRVHVRAVYLPADPPAPKRIKIDCTGWNGIRLHCEHKWWDLVKGDSFTSETEDADIMLDVQDARVLLQWPREKSKLATPTDSDSAWDENSPTRGRFLLQRSPLQSPLRNRVRLQSPISPSRAVQASGSLLASAPELAAAGTVQVYEDADAREEAEAATQTHTQQTQSTQIASQLFSGLHGDSQSSALSEPPEYSDNDEENDPIIHSFGPYGANLDSRMAAINARSSPTQPRTALSPLKASGVSPQRLRHAGPSSSKMQDHHPLINHVINQLAYSRLASTPLSTIMNNLPAHFKDTKSNTKENTALTIESLKRMLESTSCIGEVAREGKDAAGKPLESEYYYVPDMDDDAKRRDSVVEGLMKPGLRACRKQHKVRHTRPRRDHSPMKIAADSFPSA